MVIEDRLCTLKHNLLGLAPSRKLLTAGSGEAIEIFSGRSVDLNLGSKAAVASRVEASA